MEQQQRRDHLEMARAPVMYGDEMDLFALWQVLVKHKLLILYTVVLFVLAASVYAFVIATPVYKAEAVLRPPLAKDVQNLNMQNLNMQNLNMQNLNMQNLQTYTPKDVFALAVGNLKSISLQRQYFNKHHLAEALSMGDNAGAVDIERVFQKQFHEQLAVKEDKATHVVAVEFEGADAGLVAEWVNGLIALAEQQTVRNVLKNIVERISLSKKAIQETIAGKRKLALQRRMDQISKLEEALTIAKTLNIEGNGTLTVRAGSNGVSVSTEKLPLYMKGVRALQAEISALRQRKNDDAFIEGLRDLQEHLARLGVIHMNPDAVRVLRVDQQALPPGHHIKPKRMLIVLIALFGGLMFGVFGSFFADFIAKEQAHRNDGCS